MTASEPGTLSTVDGRPVLVFERRYDHPVEKVWRAITDPGELRHWFPADIEMDFVPGGKMVFTFRDGEGPTLEGRVHEIEHQRLFAFTWDTDLLRFELETDGPGCALRFSCVLGESDLGPQMEGGRPARDGTGWHMCLDALSAALDGNTPAEDADWETVHAEYVRRFAGRQ